MSQIEFPEMTDVCLDDMIDSIVTLLCNQPECDRIDSINKIKRALHRVSPFRNEPVDCVEWVRSDFVVANDYNPNRVAPPEMELLEVSILHDGYTQPIVTFPSGDNREVVDGFHRSRVGKESAVVANRINGYLPVVCIRAEQSEKSDRIASTIRHNRARGKHQVDAMSEIVIELKNRNWTNKRIAKELGMDEDEILRLCQISGLTQLFSDADFSKSWEADDAVDSDFEELTDEVDDAVRTINTDDPERVFHTFDKWECHAAGFYKSTCSGKAKPECESEFAAFLADSKRFKEALLRLPNEWKHSCDHYLTNKAMNRIAWIGQAAVCLATGIPSVFCGGFNLLTDDQREEADDIAFQFLNDWLRSTGRAEVTIDEAYSTGRQVEIY